MGGEKLKHPKYTTDEGGSPPRGRGKGLAPGEHTRYARITPAWAGKRSAWSCRPAHTKDHPRVGGEKIVTRSRSGVCRGSPPRGRGKGLHPWPDAPPAWDHPRVGGEKMTSMQKPSGAEGSPPRGRGKVFSHKTGQLIHRITPAWAGKRAPKADFITSYWDHPRVGGEKPPSRYPRSTRWGSPPRGRGKGPSVASRCKGSRITPAWAGKSPGRPGNPTLQKDHPRVGGEKNFLPTLNR